MYGGFDVFKVYLAVKLHLPLTMIILNMTER